MTKSKKPFSIGRFEMQVSLPNEHGVSTHWVAPGSVWIDDERKARKIASDINKRMGRDV